MYVLQLMDWYSASFSVLIIAIIECVVINWIYGNSRFASNVKEMLGYLPHKVWLICWKFISPVVILGILVFSFIRYEPAKYGSYLYPTWADGLGWIMCMASVVPIFVVAIYKFIRTPGSTFREKWDKATEAQATSSEAIMQSIEANGTERGHKEIDLGNDDDEPGADMPLTQQGTSLV
jgi:solute carrier family 6 amino acid transporter-like protein 5/7/9/14